MKRQIVLLACLTAAVAVAVLLRTASPIVESTAAAQSEAIPDQSAAVALADDCTITPELASHITSSDAAPPLSSTPLAVADMSLAPIADARSKVVAPSFDRSVLQTQEHGFRFTIRPPPGPNSA